MNADWQAFLATRGTVMHNGKAAAGTSGIGPTASARGIADMSHFSLLEAAGPDAVTFLQAQLCGDVAAALPGRALFSAWCNPKGRVISTLLLIPGPECVYLLVPAVLSGVVLQRLRMYVLRSQLRLSDRSAELAVIGLWGGSADSLPDLLSVAIEPDWAVLQRDDLTITRLPADAGWRALCIGTAESAANLWTAAAGTLPESPAHRWALQDALAGMAWLAAEHSEQFLPQELGLERLDGLSFDKGCYPGQEIVARVRYRGQVKRKLYRFMTAAVADPGTRIVHAADGAAAGDVIGIQPVDDARHAGLAVADAGIGKNAELHLGTADGPRVEIFAWSA
jgi:folate-binding protein YgfZ